MLLDSGNYSWTLCLPTRSCDPKRSVPPAILHILISSALLLSELPIMTRPSLVTDSLLAGSGTLIMDAIGKPCRGVYTANNTDG